MRTFFKRLIGVVIVLAGAFGIYYLGCISTITSITIPNSFTNFFDSASINTTALPETADSISPKVTPEIAQLLNTGVFSVSANLSNDTDSIPTDTEAPVFELTDLNVCYNELPSPEDFVVASSDSSAFTVSYNEIPCVDKAGSWPVEITLCDEWGNAATASATLNVFPVLKEITLELGEELPPAESFLLSQDISIAYALTPFDSAEEEAVSAGVYEISLSVNDINLASTLCLVDTTAPSGEAVTKTGCLGREYTADSLVANITDASEVKACFVAEPDWSLEGEQMVTVYLEDAAGNSSSVFSTLNLITDETGPVITAGNTTVIKGSTVSYRNLISVNDNVDSPEEITLEIDNSEVSLTELGSYNVYITATDTSGNSTEKTMVLTVAENQPVAAAAPTHIYTQEEANEAANAILATIITPGMTDSEKVYAVYRWARYNISYTHNFTIDNYVSGACRAMANRKSNCFGYACTIKTMLDILGIQNTILCVPSRPHYWNIVNLGSGYYHVDATPRIDGTLIYMWDDATIKAYSDTHGGTHAYDRSLYPAVN